MAKKVYAVKKGKTTGIFLTWEECRKNVNGFPGAQYKSFPTLQEAEQYLTQGTGKVSPAEQEESEGCILLWQGKKIEMSKAFYGTEDISMRNVAGELEGAMAAMAYCEEHKIPLLHLYYDYQGIESWATGEWKRNRPGTIKRTSTV